MKLASIVETVKPKLLKLQAFLLDKGWDSVELTHVDDATYKFVLTHGSNSNRVSFWCAVKGDEIKSFSDRNPIFADAVVFDEREFLDEAINQLAYIEIVYVMKIKFIDKPESFEAIRAHSAPIPYTKLKHLINEGVLQVVSGRDVYMKAGRPFSPLSAHVGATMPLVFVIDFVSREPDMWLVDRTGANAYYRKWAAIDYEA